MVWDAMKAIIRGKIIAFMTACKKQNQKHKDDILKSTVFLENQHQKTCSNKVYQSLTIECKKLEALETNKIQHNILYLHQRYCFNPPKSLQLLKWKVKTTSRYHQIHTIKDINGQKKTLTSDILTIFRLYYESLYSSLTPEVSKIQDFLQKHIPTKKLTPDHTERMETPVPPEEINMVIKSLKNGKSPGEDGFTAKFYKTYAQALTVHISMAFNTILTNGSFPPSWNMEVISVIPKKDTCLIDPFPF